MSEFSNRIKNRFAIETPRKRKLVPWLILCLSLLVTLYAWHVVSHSLKKTVGERFAVHADEITKQIVKRIQTNRTVLRGGVALFAANAEVSREQWRTYVENLRLKETHPGIQGFGFAKVIRPDELQSHVATIRGEGFPEYAVRPEGERDDYTAIIWLEPFDERNRRAFGYDMFSEPVRRAAMEAARDTDAATLSGKVMLVQETGKDLQSGFLMYVPVYRKGAPYATVAQRRAALLGYVYSPLRMKDLIQRAIGDTLSDIDLKIYDGTEMSDQSLMFDRDEACREPSRHLRRLFNDTRVVEIYGRKWTLHFSSLPSFESLYERQIPLGILLSGVLCSLLLFLFVCALERTRAKALAIASDMTGALRKSEERYRSLATAISQIVWTTNAQGEVDEDIPDWRAYTGQSFEEIKGWSWSNALHPEDYERTLSAWRQALENRSIYDTHYRIQRHDGEYQHFTVRGVPVLEKDGNIREWVGTCTDITEQKRVEDTIRAQVRLLDLIFTHSLGCLILLDKEYNFIRVNEEYAKACQRDPSEFPGHNHFEFYPSPLKDEFDDAIREKTIYARNARPFIFPDHPEWGMTYWDLRMVPIRDAEDSVELIILTLENVTERVRAEKELTGHRDHLEEMVRERTKALHESQENFRLIAETISEVFWIADVQIERMFYISPAYERVWKRSCKSLYENPRSFADAIHPDDRERVFAELEVQKTGRPFEHDYRIIQPDGTIRWIWDRGFPVFDEAGRVTRYAGISQDITERKQADINLRQAKTDAEKANNAKSDFLANMSHELRTPLNSVIGFSEVLQDQLCGPLNDKQMEYVNNIHSSGRHLLSLINDILDLSKVEAGKLELDLDLLSVRDLLDSSVKMLRERAIRNGLDLRLTMAPEADLNIMADLRKLKQVMYNLLSNAIKFTPEGGSVSVTAKRVSEPADYHQSPLPPGGGGLGWGGSCNEDDKLQLHPPPAPLPSREGEKTHADFIEISVTDSGLGIRQEDLPKLFKPFTQLAPAYTKEYEGTGLGLALTKKLLELHGGNIWVESEIDQGSRFSFMIPVKQKL